MNGSRRRPRSLLLPLLALAAAAVSSAAADAPGGDGSSPEAPSDPAIVASVEVGGAGGRKAYVLDGEDAAFGAFRYAEGDGFDARAAAVLDVARGLAERLPEGYAPPKEFTHCGGDDDGKKARPCTAGKLWKRAEEMRSAEMHDAAGADLIRTLLKPGIERDFQEKAERTLDLALYNVKKQREREAREAEEEAKLERRRKEEEEAATEAAERKLGYEAEWATFSKGLKASISEATVDAHGKAISDSAVANALHEFGKEEGSGDGDSRWEETIRLIKKISPADKTIDVLLVEARCHEMLGNHKGALSAAGNLVKKASNYEPWINGSPRMMAVTVGANAAMQLGLSENALSFFQTVLKFDPEQPRAREQYRGLKKVVKLLKKADEQIQKGYNKKASEIIDDCLSAMRGLDVDSPLFRSKTQLKLCTILSGMGQHEEALRNCDPAVVVRIESDHVSPESRKEAHLVRAEALLLDMDYDEAVQDLRAAFDLVPESKETMEEKRELNQKLQMTIRQQEAWNGGQTDQRFNEHTGYPDGRPPERDHTKILQLPLDLDQRKKEVKCAWLKKQFKNLVRRYHPDKYKGNRKRAARKFQEVKDSKEHVSATWGC